ncbi:unnamed protein product, partial [marine sediment metagenome]
GLWGSVTTGQTILNPSKTSGQETVLIISFCEKGLAITG